MTPGGANPRIMQHRTAGVHGPGEESSWQS
jgi:hypothetical protein